MATTTSLRIRSESDAAAIEALKAATGHKAGSQAIWHAIRAYPALAKGEQLHFALRILVDNIAPDLVMALGPHAAADYRQVASEHFSEWRDSAEELFVTGNRKFPIRDNRKLHSLWFGWRCAPIHPVGDANRNGAAYRCMDGRPGCC